MRIIFLACICLLIACDTAEEIKLKQYKSFGQVLYNTHCLNCHGISGEGFEKLYPTLRELPLSGAYQKEMACLIKNGGLMNGKRSDLKMPAVTNLTADEIAKIMTFVGNSFDNQIGLVSGDSLSLWLNSCARNPN